ncbi:hypothetical protein MNBD_GAMMA03-162 [hydrothermal vent metagenome]|uniref:Uncharacterized protein n=1 Tax=hydrothermal vent metagenome TaxID=652676 RepID=A0A3B0WIT2_9ZZZZ
MKTWLVFFIVFLVLVLSKSAIAKSKCSENLAKAQSEFDAGRLYDIPSLLRNCIKNGTNQDKIASYELLTITYLYIDDHNAAQESFKKLLRLDPEYRVENTEYIELVHLSKEFITRPIISWRARLGTNVTSVSSIYNNGANNSNLNSGKYAIGFGFSAIGSLDIHVSKSLTFSLEPELSSNLFKYSDTFFDLNGVQNSKDILELQENSFNAALPISIKYTHAGKLYYPYIYAGYSPNYNLSTTSDAIYVNNIGGADVTTEDKNINLNSLRQPFSQSLILGIGIMRRIKYKYVFIDVRYKLGLTNRLLRDGQDEFDSNADVNKYIQTYKMIDNDFRQNEFNITLGYVWPQYKPRKRKSVTVKSFVGGLFKKENRDE